MASRSRNLEIRLTADADGVRRGTRDAERSLERMNRVGGRAFKGMSAAAVAGGAVVAGGLAVVGKQAIDTASDIEESTTKNRQLFGKFADDVERFAGRTSKSMGISRAAALEATGTFGGLFEALQIGDKPSSQMSTRLTQLAADLASFNNASPEEALEALRSGLSGESEPMRKFNAFLSEGRVKSEAYKSGIAAVGSELSEKQKVQARYNLILKDTEKAHGDFARTSGGLANQQRALKAQLSDVAGQLGTVLIPAAAKAARALVSVVDAVRESWPAIQRTARRVFEAVGDAVGVARREITRWVNRNRDDIDTFIKAVRNVARAVREVFVEHVIPIVKRMLPAIKQTFEGVTRLIRGAVRIISGILTGDFGKAWSGVKDIFKGGLKTVLGFFRAITAPFRQAVSKIGDTIKDGFSKAFGWVVDKAVGFVNTIIGIVNKIPGVDIDTIATQSADNVGSGARNAGRPQSDPRGRTGPQRRQTGGKITAPTVIMGEEAPAHPEWVIATNPAYRKRNVGLWMEAGRDLGVMPFQTGGLRGRIGPGSGRVTTTGPNLGDVAGDVASSLPGVGPVVGPVVRTAGDLIDDLPSNPFTGVFAGLGKFILDKAKGVIRRRAPETAATYGPGAATFTGRTPAGVGVMDGRPVAKWIIPILQWARGHGWGGSVNSGFRTYAEQLAIWNSGVRPAAFPGTSNHEGSAYPRGAVDVSDYGTLAGLMTRYPGNPKLRWYGPGDEVHFSATGRRKGGIVGKRRVPPIGKKQLGWMQGIWGRIAPLFGQDPATNVSDLFTYTEGRGPFVGVDGVDPANGKFGLIWPRWVHKGKNALDPTTRTKLFIHEMAHRFQGPGVKTAWEAEGGAEAFARITMSRMFGGARYDPTDPYNADTTRAVQKRGWRWITKGQFGFARGGRLSLKDIAVLAGRAGFRGYDRIRATAIAMRESTGNPRANNAGLNQNGTVDHGLMQINDVWRNDPDIGKIGWANRYKALSNMLMARVVLRKQGWQAWDTGHGVEYGTNIPAARRAVLATQNIVRGGGGKQQKKKNDAKKPAKKTPKAPRTHIAGGPITTDAGKQAATLGTPLEWIEAKLAPLEADAALAALTPDGVDDWLVAANIKNWTDQGLQAALATGDPALIADWAGRAKSAQDNLDQIRNDIGETAPAGTGPFGGLTSSESGSTSEDGSSLADVIAENTRVLESLRDEVAQQNTINMSELGIGLREAKRALADMISGEIVGHGIVPRSALPSNGTVAAY